MGARLRVRVCMCAVAVWLTATVAAAQGLGGAGIIQGTVTDPTGAVVPGATVELKNPISGFDESQVTDGQGRYVFRNLLPSAYHLTVVLMGFESVVRDVTIRAGVPVNENDWRWPARRRRWWSSARPT